MPTVIVDGVEYAPVGSKLVSTANPKFCACGGRGQSVNSRTAPDHWYRRYECKVCGARWSTTEIKLP